MIDPLTLKICLVSAVQYWRHPFKPVLTQENCIKYVVLDIEKGESGNLQNRQNYDNDRMCFAEVTIARDSDLGVNDTQFQTTTHLGHILNVGDTVLGYDLQFANVSDEDLKTFKGELPEVILVKKSYQRKNRRSKRRFKVKKMAIEAPDKIQKKSEVAKTETDFQNFLEDLEEDPELRKHVNMYKKDEQKGKTMNDAEEEDEEDELPGLNNLLDNFSFNMKDGPDDEDEDEDKSKEAAQPVDFGTSSSSTS